MQLSTADYICISGFWGASPPNLHRGSAPGPRWVTSVPQTPVPTLPPNPGYATARECPMIPGYSPKLAEIVGFRLHRTMTYTTRMYHDRVMYYVLKRVTMRVYLLYPPSERSELARYCVMLFSFRPSVHPSVRPSVRTAHSVVANISKTVWVRDLVPITH